MNLVCINWSIPTSVDNLEQRRRVPGYFFTTYPETRNDWCFSELPTISQLITQSRLGDPEAHKPATACNMTPLAHYLLLPDDSTCATLHSPWIWTEAASYQAQLQAADCAPAIWVPKMTLSLKLYPAAQQLGHHSFWLPTYSSAADMEKNRQYYTNYEKINDPADNCAWLQINNKSLNLNVLNNPLQGRRITRTV